MTTEFHPFNTGHVLVVNYDFQTHRLWERDFDFTVSEKGRLLFRHHPALFQGMKPARLGQYTLYRGFAASGHYHHEAETVILMFDNPDYDRQKGKFLRQVLKTVGKQFQQIENNVLGYPS